MNNLERITEKPLVSVVIPTYNRREMVKRCVKSVLEGRYDNIEVKRFNKGFLDKAGQSTIH